MITTLMVGVGFIRPGKRDCRANHARNDNGRHPPSLKLWRTRKSRPYVRLKHLIAAFSLLVIFAGAAYLYIDGNGNFRTVSPGRIYRSGQLTEKQLMKYVSEYNIRSVLNLRGRNEQADWWKKEVAVSGRLGLKYYNVRLSSDKEPSEEKIQEVIAILQEAPKPLLIHCLAGADRSGLVSAIYLYRFEKYPYKKARGQLSLIYGHSALLRPRTKAMDRAFANFCGR